ncbi:MAG TPA: tol-pal system protein YbgF, partial [Hellea balneolensis]|nr:tol-pal system protein YbgF [Hellea balneolensis]
TKLAELGKEKMSEGDFAGAQADFEQYLQLNPDAKDKADVYFWLGEAYYARSGFSKAAENYIASMRAAPKGKYAPEAMVKLAATARALGKKDMACKTLNSFPGQFPNASDSVRAKVRLEKQRSGC